MIINNTALFFLKDIKLKWLCLAIVCYSGQWSFAATMADEMMVNVFCDVLNDATTSTSADGQVQISINGGVPPYEMLIINANNNDIVAEQIFNTDISFSYDGLSAGAYFINVSDQTAAQSNCDFTIHALTCSITATVNDVMVDCFGDEGVLEVLVEGVPPYDYQWNIGGTNAQLTGISTGTYTVTVTDNANCMAVATGQITSPAAVLAFCDMTSPASSTTSEDGSAVISLSGGVAPYDFSIRNSQNELIIESSSTIFGTSFSVNGLDAGMYHMQVNDFNACATSCNFTVGLQNCNLLATLEDVVLSCFNDETSIESIVSGGLPPYQYQWDNGQTTSLLTNVRVGMYSVTITDQAACTITETVTVSQPSILSTSCDVLQNVSFTGGSDGIAQIHVEGGSPPYQFELLDMNNVPVLDGFILAASTFSMDNLAASSYQLIVEDNQNCSGVCLFQITEPQCLMIVEIADDNVPCNGDLGGLTAMVSGATPPYQYFWSNGTSASFVSDLPADTYTVTVTDNTGCRVIRAGNILEPEVLEVVCTVLHQGSITGEPTGQIEAFITGGTATYTYEVSGGQSGTSNQEGAAIIDELLANDYDLMITDANGCTADCTFSIFPCAMEVSTSFANVSCFGGSDGSMSVQVTGAVAPIEYDWNIDDFDGQSSIQNIPAGTYQVTVRDANHCVVTKTITISQSTEGFDLTCDLQPGLQNLIFSYTIVEGNAPYHVSIQGDNFELEQEQLISGTYSITVPSENTMYQVTVIDANQCTKSCVTTLVPRDCNTLFLAPHYQGSFDCGMTPGYGTAFVVGGTPPYQFYWSNGINSQYNNELIPSQTYGVSVVDATGCLAEKPILIPASSELSVQIEAIPSSDHETATLIAHVTGGLPPYFFEWNTGSSAAELHDVPSGIYSLSVRDFNFCTAIASVDWNNNHSLLPVVPNLDARKKGSLGILFWTLAEEAEANILSYDLEKKLVDDDGFSSLVQFEKGNDTQNFYTYHDEKLLAGDNFYRLRVHYADGSFGFSEIKSLHFNLVENNITLFPNPARDELNILLPVSTEEQVTLDIYNHLGQLVQQDKRLVQPDQAIRLQLEAFTNGLYSISVKLKQGKRLAKKFVVENFN